MPSASLTASSLPLALNATDSILEPWPSERLAILLRLPTSHKYVVLLPGPPAVASIEPSGLNASAPPPGLRVPISFVLFTSHR